MWATCRSSWPGSVGVCLCVFASENVFVIVCGMCVSSCTGPGAERWQEAERDKEDRPHKRLNISSPHKALMEDKKCRPTYITLHMTFTVANPNGLGEAKAD